MLSLCWHPGKPDARLLHEEMPMAKNRGFSEGSSGSSLPARGVNCHESLWVPTEEVRIWGHCALMLHYSVLLQQYTVKC